MLVVAADESARQKKEDSPKDNGFELIACGPVGDAKAFGGGFQRFLAEQAVGQSRFGAYQAEDADEVRGDGRRASPRGRRK